MTVAEDFAIYVQELRGMKLPDSTRHAARRCLLDWLGATIAGGPLEPANLMSKALPSTSGNSRLLPTGHMADIRTAALINGTAAHIVEVDDIYRSGLYHPGAPTIAAALATAEHIDADGDAFLKAITAGYEVSNRIARAMGAAHYEFWHMTATVGHFGAAVASGYLLNLTEKQMAHAIAQSATWAAGLKQAFASEAMSKPVHSGRAAEAGVTSALVSKAGATAVLDMLEGRRGIGAAMAQMTPGRSAWKTTFDDLGTSYTIERITVKNHACCGHTFAAIDGALELIGANEISPDEIAKIDVASYSQAIEVCGNAQPVTPAEARFSLPYTLATSIVNRAPCSLESFSDAALKKQKTRELMERISIQVSQECDDVFPGKRSAFVEITTQDGQTFKTHRKTRIGDPDAPLSDDQLAVKFKTLAAPWLGDERASHIVAAVQQLGKNDKVRDMPVCQESSIGAQAAE